MEKEDPIARIEREKAEKKKSNGFAVIVLSIVAVGLAVALAIVGTRDYKMVKELEADKADLTERIGQLQEDFANLSSDYDYINSQLDSSREEVAVLVSRIKRTEATNRAKMREYEKELGTLRSIMRNYLVQIDSLNQQNQKLSAELTTTRKNLAEATGKNHELEAENKEYKAKVATGSVVKARGIVCKAYNGSDKVTDRSSRVRRLAVELSLVENDLAMRGPMTIYLRVKDPDGNLLLDGTNASFTFAGEAVAATASREVDYEGAEVDMIIYVNDIPQYVKGVYTAEVYSASGLLGETELVLR
ncbi:MAG: hypothetical protein J6X77_00970 [Bacteroidales bacterium]|nr:hypothetical protein [Bacteroidales bacterium]